MNKANSSLKKAKEIIDKGAYITLSTVSNAGMPWNSPLWYARDEKYNFYFVSPKNTQHSNNIRENGKGFIVIYDTSAPEGTGEGVYMTVQVKELISKNAVERAIKYLYRSKAKTRRASEFLNNSPRRIYVVQPKEVWINDAEEKEGLYLDYRIPIDIKNLSSS